MDTSKKDKQNKNQLLNKKRNLEAELKSIYINKSKINIEKKNRIKLIEIEAESKKKKIREQTITIQIKICKLIRLA